MFSGMSRSSNSAAQQFDPSLHPGLINLGNTCFLNSVLQAIGSTRQFKLLLDGPSQQLHHEFSQQHGYTSINRTEYEWTDRMQSPALRVCDDEHGRLQSSSLPLSPRLPAEGMATIRPKPRVAALAPSVDSNQQHHERHEPTVVDLPLNTAFRHTLERLWTDSRSVRPPNINPKQLLSLLGAKYDQYLEYGQQDGHELMRHLLDACRMEEMDLIKKMQPPKPNKRRRPADLQPDDVEKGQAISNSVSVDGNGQLAVPDGRNPTIHEDEPEQHLLPFLDMLFCGKLASMVVCEGCRKVSHTYEDFYDLSLSLRSELETSRSRKRDRIRSMADRWRRATQGKPSDKVKANGDFQSGRSTPLGSNPFSETETSDVETRAKQGKKGGLLSPDEGGKAKFMLRKRSITKSLERRAEKLGATSGSEMEPDFPDMASMSLAPVPSQRQQAPESAPASAGEEDGDARTSSRTARMLGAYSSVSSSRESSPQPPLGGRSAAAPQNGLNAEPVHRQGPSSQQAAYISRILADDLGSSSSSAARRPGLPGQQFSDLVAAASAARGKPVAGLNGLYRLQSFGASKKSALSEFEKDPNSPAAKHRKRIQEEQSSTGLIAALRQFTGVEVLDGENSFACKNCWRLQNPPNARERERLRRRRARRGLAEDPDDESEPSSSEGGSESDAEDAVLATKQVMNPPDQTHAAAAAAAAAPSDDVSEPAGRGTQSPESPQTPRAALGGKGHPISIPTIQMTSPDTPPASLANDAGKQLGNGPDSDASSASGVPVASADDRLASVRQGRRSADSSDVSASSSSLRISSGYDTGTETDQSGITSLESESGAEDGDASDHDDGAGSKNTAKPAPTKAKGPKRSAQSLPRRALKRYLIASAPPVLIFHLKRFQATGRGFVSGLAGFKKIDDQVTFPEYLDITPWLAPPREEYDRKGRLKGTSDPLAIRKRAEEEAKQAGMDVKNVHVEMESREARHRRRRRHWKHGGRHDRQDELDVGDDGKKVPGKRHSMWSWTIKEPVGGSTGSTAAANGLAQSMGETVDADEVQEGAEVKRGSKEILPAVLPRPRTEYRLYAVIVHQGSLSAGHYTAYVLSDKIKLKVSDALTSMSAPPSRTPTPAPVQGTAARRGSSGGPAGTLMVPAGGAGLSPLSPADDAETPGVSGITITASTSDKAASSSSVSEHVLSSSGSLGSDGGGQAQAQADLLRPQTSISSMGSSTTRSSTDASREEIRPVASATRVANANGTAGAIKDDGRRWVYTSDTIVRAATIDEVLRAKAYMLFYERI